MTANYDKKFIFNVLKSQIENRLSRGHPYDNVYESAAELFWDSICENGVMHLNRVKIPDIRWFRYIGWYEWPMIYADSIIIHHLFNDEYSEENVFMLESLGVEGPYGFENITVEKGDVVIDAGAYIGDWAAVAARMGGNVYAFEPSPAVREILYKTADLNDFRVVEAGLGDVVCKKLINTNMEPASQEINDKIGTPCDLTTLDVFTKKKDVHIDFIKSDIEGYEANMLKGATRVLKEDCPKLAIRIYHNDGRDCDILPPLIRKINPEYKIIMRKKTLYAYVP
jgi:FkbM family methyltransferase